jgi:hypothetical protein
MTPIRLQLRRTRGFVLADVSRASNGLEARVVTRASNWGNPYVIRPAWPKGTLIQHAHYHCESVQTAKEAVDMFREYLRNQPGYIAEAGEHLRGYNLACACAIDAEYCHADVWLDVLKGDDDG